MQVLKDKDKDPDWKTAPMIKAPERLRISLPEEASHVSPSTYLFNPEVIEWIEPRPENPALPHIEGYPTAASPNWTSNPALDVLHAAQERGYAVFQPFLRPSADHMNRTAERHKRYHGHYSILEIVLAPILVEIPPRLKHCRLQHPPEVSHASNPKLLSMPRLTPPRRPIWTRSRSALCRARERFRGTRGAFVGMYAKKCY
ncbi:hypothetical protein K505DRAFT_393647 [Melanomma pulvis-pyrius CBS 109.77]|uniref:Uncharacterized protein n=1 Tax=Melanomma pulvis-pyrius CBS 109.77 TaxID=1314802 RepID=A0A6A6XQV8_9PLEO|nr:hypothetical protein K505DRAFT_393647 [Melanomma pulvis-pyrius CBS 109.77]